MNELTDTERGWLAAMVDGEGSLIMTERSDGSTHSPKIRVTSTSRDLIDRLHDLVPNGKIYENGSTGENHSQAYQFAIQRYDDIEWVLEEIGPLLIEKQEKAELMLEYISVRRQATVSRSDDGTFAPEEDRSQEERIFSEFRSL